MPLTPSNLHVTWVWVPAWCAENWVSHCVCSRFGKNLLLWVCSGVGARSPAILCGGRIQPMVPGRPSAVGGSVLVAPPTRHQLPLHCPFPRCLFSGAVASVLA